MSIFNEWLVFSLILLGIWLIVFLSIRIKTIKKEMLVVSLLTAPLGLTEPLFVPEYWSPPSLFDLAARTGFDIESLALARALGFLIKEVPITWSHQQESKVGMLSYVNVLADVLRIRWRLRRGIYNISQL